MKSLQNINKNKKKLKLKHKEVSKLENIFKTKRAHEMQQDSGQN